MNKYEKRFRKYLAQTPSSRIYLQRICEARQKKGDLPVRVTLDKGCHRVPPVLIDLFGAGSLSLSRNGQVRLSLQSLLSPLNTEQQEEWLLGLYAALGLAFEPVLPPGPIHRNHLILLEQWRLKYPDLAPLYLLLKDHLIRSTRLKGKSRDPGMSGLQYHWFTAGEIVSFLRENQEAISVSALGARFINDSKALRGGELINTIADWLIILDGEGDDYLEGPNIPAPVRRHLRQEALRRHGVVDNPSAIKVTLFGPLVYWKAGSCFQYVSSLWEQGETATLSMDNLAGIEKIAVPEGIDVYGCENESPFYELVRRRHPGMVIFTQGFPNAAVMTLWRLLARNLKDRHFYHWGDSDLAGLRIAAMLHAVYPLRLWRCDIETLQRYGSGLRALGPQLKEQARRYLAAHENFAFQKELSFTLENGWLEQERFQETDCDSSS